MNEHYRFALPSLPYEYAAYEPFLDAETIQAHYQMYFQEWIHRLNVALDGYPALHAMSPVQLGNMALRLPPELKEDIVQGSGALFWHTLYFEMLRPPENEWYVSEPENDAARLLRKEYGSINGFLYEIRQAALRITGSGWVWVYIERGKRGTPRIGIGTVPDHGIPELTRHVMPLLCVDLWEHAYLRKYGTNRSGYINAWCRCVNWEKLDEKLRGC